MTVIGRDMDKIVPFLWFDEDAEEAANFYVSVFRNARIVNVVRYGESAATASGRPKGSVMTVAFELEGQPFAALNGGPHFSFSPAVSFVVTCDSQEELDEMWERLSAGGDESAQQCGWLTDRYGVSWQIVPADLGGMMTDPDPARSERVMKALLGMKKLDGETLRKAYDGEHAG